MSGHGLRFEGAAFLHNSRGELDRVWGQGVGGYGYALCACGATSPTPLPSAYQRKAWHRSHKAEVAA